MWRLSDPIRKLFARTARRSSSIKVAFNNLSNARPAAYVRYIAIPMKLNTALRAWLLLAAGAVAFCATEIWNTKDPSVWTTEDANIILNKSPWAKQIKVGSNQRPMQRGGRRGGMGYPGGGYPGGGYPGGGGGYPGGGGGYPQGGNG